MQKEKKKGRSIKRSAQDRQSIREAKRNFKYVLITLALSIGLIFAGTFFYLQTKNAQRPELDRAQAKNVKYQFRETGKTLPPELFRGRVFEDYQIARRIPEVLDQLYCYCRCEKNLGHLNLLTCYTSWHASTCEICLDEAQLASRMNGRGASPAQIQAEIDRRFG